MGLLNGGIECIAAADLRGPPPDAGGRGYESNHLRGGRRG